MKKVFKTVAGFYLIVCLFALCCEPNETVPMWKFLTYYGVVLINFAIAIFINNKIFKNASSTN
jgi:hypothetical protein